MSTRGAARCLHNKERVGDPLMAKQKQKEAPAEVEETEDEEMELEELEEDADEADEAPKKAKGGQPEVTFGASDLAKHLSKELGKTITPRELRTQIRRMAREETPRVDREITAGNRSRYDWPLGLKDPEVKAIIKAVKAGELEAGKKEALDKLKEQKAAKKAAAGDDAPKGKKGKKGKSAPEPEPDDDEIEEIGEDELEDE